MKRILSVILSMMLLLSTVPVYAISVSGGTGTTDIVITADAATFSVTVPTSIPVNVDSNAVVTCPASLQISNDSAAPIEVTSIEIQNGQWSITDYNHGDRSKLAKAKVDADMLGLAFKPSGGKWAETCATGTQSLGIDVDEWVVASQGSLAFSCKGIATAVSNSISEPVAAAKVIFTVGWKDGLTPTGYQIQAIEDVMDEDGNVAIKLGDSVSLEAIAVYSEDTPVWTSQNTSVVHITQNGIATAVGVGNATVTYTYGGFSAEVLFKVTCDHLDTELRNYEDATYIDTGYTGDTYCVDCGALVAAGTVIPVKSCPHSDTEIQGAYAATCTSNGYSGDTYCNDCQQVISYGSSINSTGHLYELTDTVKATNNVDGKHVYTCSNCGDSYDDVIPAVPLQSFSLEDESGVVTLSITMDMTTGRILGRDTYTVRVDTDSIYPVDTTSELKFEWYNAPPGGYVSDDTLEYHIVGYPPSNDTFTLVVECEGIRRTKTFRIEVIEVG